MAGQVGPRLEADVVLADRNLVTTGQGELRGPGTQARPRPAHIIGVAGLGSQPGKSGKDGVRGGVAESSRAQGAVQGTRDPGDVGQPATCREVIGEREGRPHGPDRVGAGWTDPHGEKVEGRAVHEVSSVWATAS